MRYEVVRRIGRGGTGVVDLAIAADGRPVALKRLALHGSPGELATARQRVRREAEVLRGLDHPAIVRLLDVFDDGDDLVLVMDHLSGGNLAQRVADHGPLAPEAVRAVGDRLLDALAAAHRQGVVHRDIKPANVLFDEHGDAHLADFGAATSRDATVGLTASHMVVGTAGFMAPEQARGEPVTAASDVFSLGATLAFAATGRGPFGTADPQVLMLRAAAGQVDRLPRALPADLRGRLGSMLDKDPARRPTAAAARGGPAGTEVRSGAGAAGIDRRQMRRWVPAVLGALLLGAGALAVLAMGGTGPGSAAPPRSPARTASGVAATAPCRPLPFQPCGQPPAPGTDGRRCIDGRADYDGDPRNGCEAIPDRLPPGTRIVGSVEANLVPADEVDTYVVHVADHFQLLCNGQVHIRFTAPAGASQRLTVLDPTGRVLGTAGSTDGTPAEVALKDPSCFRDDTTDLTVRVSSIGPARTAAPYRIQVSGSY